MTQADVTQRVRGVTSGDRGACEVDSLRHRDVFAGACPQRTTRSRCSFAPAIRPRHCRTQRWRVRARPGLRTRV